MQEKNKNQKSGYLELAEELEKSCSILASEIRESRSNGSILSDDKKLDNFLKILDKASKVRVMISKEKEPESKGEEIETVTTTSVKKRTNIQNFVMQKDE